MTKAAPDAYRAALDAVGETMDEERKADDVLQATVDLLYERFAHYSWVKESAGPPRLADAPKWSTTSTQTNATSHVSLRPGARSWCR